MTDAITLKSIPDSHLWADVCLGDVTAFETVVRRHQSAVAAVAYALCGDRSASEDIAQETFWIGWKDRAALQQPDRLRSWLCGIARNLARQTSRSRSPYVAALSLDPEAMQPEPLVSAISAEEEALVWRSLEEIPETYREPLVLFYREQQSVAEVASALDVSVDAVKQRLSRGRAMLRDQIHNLVEGTLWRTRPSAALTVAIMTGLATQKAAWAAASAATGTTVGKAVVASSLGLWVGPLLGSLGGLAGAWLGTWIPAQMAPTNREREFIQREGRKILVLSIVFTVGILLTNLLPALLPMSRPLVIAIIAGNVALTFAFVIFILVETRRMNERLRKLREELSPGTDENHTALRRQAFAFSRRWRGRVWRSSTKLCGLPLVDLNVSNPYTPVSAFDPQPMWTPRRARGWIAIGDEARGILFALGGRAYGGIAIGGIAVGVVAIGGFSMGLLAFGGMAVGALVFGGAGIGWLAAGGLAVGWQAVGGLAVAWDVAVGGLALSQNAADGGVAIARNLAVGGMAQAVHANDEVAKAFLLNHSLKRAMEWQVANNLMVTAVIIAVSFLPSVLCWPLLYRRATAEELAADHEALAVSPPAV